jgi:hypothetical protein
MESWNGYKCYQRVASQFISPKWFLGINPDFQVASNAATTNNRVMNISKELAPGARTVNTACA